jgi:hypothetical protein
MIPGTSWSQLSRNPRYAVVLTLGLIFLMFLTFSAWRRHDRADYIDGQLCSMITPALDSWLIDLICVLSLQITARNNVLSIHTSVRPFSRLRHGQRPQFLGAC